MARHAELLRSGGRSSEASRLLGARRTDDPALRRDFDSLRIRFPVTEGDLNGALALARAGQPGNQADLARALGAAGRLSDARARLARACRRLEGRSAGDCGVLRGWLSR